MSDNTWRIALVLLCVFIFVTVVLELARLIEKRTRPRRRVRWTIDALIVLAATTLTAIVGLSIEHGMNYALGGPADHDLPRLVTHICLAILLTIVLLWMLDIRAKRNELQGTLYYVRYLSEWMNDWHIEGLRRRGQSLSDVRTLARSIDTRAEIASRDLDISADIAQLSRDLELVMADDDSSTGYSLAINAIWPGNVVLGFHLVNWQNMRMLSQRPTQTPPRPRGQMPWTEWVKTWTDRRLTAIRRERRYPPPDLDFSLDLRAGWLNKPCLQQRSKFSTFIRHKQVDDAERSSLPVWVSVEATPRAGSPLHWRHQRAIHVCAFVDGVPTSEITVTAHKKAKADFVTVDQVVLTTVATLRRILHDEPHQMIVLTMRVPPSVAATIGYYLGNRGEFHSAVERLAPDDIEVACGMMCPQISCRYPLRNLIFALYNQSDDDGGPYKVVRAHDSQYSLLDQVALLRPVLDPPVHEPVDQRLGLETT